MTDHNDLYAEVKKEVEALASPLFDFSEICVKKRGNFLPHGAVLKTDGSIELVTAAPSGVDGRSTSTEVLPALHQGLRTRGKILETRAVAVAENVTITMEGKPPTEAVKVLLEHKNGLAVALYLPFKKRLFRSPVFGEIFALPAKAEVSPWHAA